MINPYAHTFMIAARLDRVVPPRLRAARDDRQLESQVSRWRIPAWFAARAARKSR